ncbi:MAG: hypothetical protein M3P04_01170 [Actinomycetota bacterium]|nr:hypothetical protein [Actinomycetota bacterium]
MRRALALLALASLAACSSSDDKRSAVAGSPSPTTSAGSSAATANPGARVSAEPGASVGAAASASPTGAASTSPATRATTAPGKPSASKATAPGTYTYDASGTQTISGSRKQVSGSSTLQISAVSNGQQTSTLHNAQGDTEQQILVRDAGSYLSSLKITSLMGVKEFAFSPAALLLPDPARVGATWSWGGTSTDGKTTARATNKVVRTETLTIGGQRVATVVLQTHLVLSGDYTYTADVTTWVAPAYRLPVKDHTVANGRYGAFPFSFDVTDVMRSVHPA